MARLSAKVSEGGRSQSSCCFCPMTSVIDLRNGTSRRAGTKPATRTSPPLGWSSPERTLRVVVFPAPFGPRNPTRSPAPTEKEMPSTAFTASWRLWKRDRIDAPSPGSRRWTRYSLRNSRTSITAGHDKAVREVRQRLGNGHAPLLTPRSASRRVRARPGRAAAPDRRARRPPALRGQVVRDRHHPHVLPEGLRRRHRDIHDPSRRGRGRGQHLPQGEARRSGTLGEGKGLVGRPVEREAGGPVLLALPRSLLGHRPGPGLRVRGGGPPQPPVPLDPVAHAADGRQDLRGHPRSPPRPGVRPDPPAEDAAAATGLVAGACADREG